MDSYEPLLRIEGASLAFDGKPILMNIAFSVSKGEIVALLGPSGCGKTTLLRIIAGLTPVDAGHIKLMGEDLAQIPVHKRNFGMVFQDYALFPHKNVTENVAFGLRMRGWDRQTQAQRVHQILELVGLAGLENRRVFELSGGEQQRVALARSLAPAPQLLLLDEPLGALDRALREQLMGELRLILKRAGELTSNRLYDEVPSDREEGVRSEPSGLTSIYVTHDQEEAFAVADRIIIMNAGHIEQVGKPGELYRHPESQFVARFLGMHNLLPITEIKADPPTVTTDVGEFRISQKPEGETSENLLLIRPGAGQIVTANEVGVNHLTGIVQQVSFRGRHQVVSLQVMGESGTKLLKLSFKSSVPITGDGERLTVKLDPAEIQLVSR